jgi:hypothetical protein
MSVTLTDAQYGSFYRAVMTVANGYRWRDGKCSTRISRTESVDICRRAATDLELDWQKFKLEEGDKC